MLWLVKQSSFQKLENKKLQKVAVKAETQERAQLGPSQDKHIKRAEELPFSFDFKKVLLQSIVYQLMSKESKNWTNYEDRALRELKEQRGLEKWSIISKVLEDQFQIAGKSAKRCRDRYNHHLDCRVRKDQWTHQEQLTLEKLHNEKGNRWMEIAVALQRSDNDVKNHFHSKFRRAIRRINFYISAHLRSQFRPLRNNLVSKLLKTSEDYYQQVNKDEATVSKLAFGMIFLYTDIKNQIFHYLNLTQKEVADDLLSLKILIKEANHFSKMFKRNGKSQLDAPREQNRQVKYKGKEILLLIDQNRDKKQTPSEQPEDPSHSEQLEEVPKEQNSIGQPAQPSPSQRIPQQSQVMMPIVVNPYYPLGNAWPIMGHPYHPLFQNYLPYPFPVGQQYAPANFHHPHEKNQITRGCSQVNKRRTNKEQNSFPPGSQEKTDLCKKEDEG